MKNPQRWVALACFSLLTLSGCGTVANLVNPTEDRLRLGSAGPHVYGGLRMDVDILDSPGHLGPLLPFFVIDVPLSLVLDTALLPLTIPYSLLRPDPEARQVEELEKILRLPIYTLAESVDLALKDGEVGGETAVSAKMTRMRSRGEVDVSFAKEGKTVGIAMEIADGTILSRGASGFDQSELAQALKIKLSDAIRTALKHEKGTATGALIWFNEFRKPECEVQIYRDGQVRIITVDGETGKVSGMKDVSLRAQRLFWSSILQ